MRSRLSLDHDPADSSHLREGLAMRLTLRTLLAWLDDTLQPTQVKEIGKQVAESPFAQELSDRIHRVSRQRRLTAPSRSGPEGTDPNVVASYLDNDLDPEAVAEYEKKCLTSDVNLAEVASVHQILSLLGQKAKVPPEARARMYQLVKGREAIPTKRSEPRRPHAPEPVTKPIAPWILPEPPKRRWLERYGPIAACLVLIAVSVWSAIKSLTGQPPGAVPVAVQREGIPRHQPAVAAPPVTEGANPAEEGQDQLASATRSQSARESESTIPVPGSEGAPARGTARPGGADSLASTPGSEEASTAEATKESSVGGRSKEPAALAKVPPGASGVAEVSDGILLRFDSDQREWVRLTGTTSLVPLDRLLCLAPFRATVTLAKTRIVLVGETEVRLLSRSTDKMPALELVSGRLFVRLPASSSLKVGPSDRAATLEAAQDTSFALERIARREYGQAVTGAPPLTVYCSQGELALSVGNRHDTSSAPAVVNIDSSGQLQRATSEPLPTWVTEADPSSLEVQLREQFLPMFHAGRPVVTEIVEAVDKDRVEIKKLSISALKALGDLSYLMPVLSRKDDPAARRIAMEAVRAYMAQGREAAARLREQLAQEFGDEKAVIVEKMLVGYSKEEASDPMTFKTMVELLSPDQESVGIRELALDTLKRLTGRDDLTYNPDRPAEGKGLNAWRDLLRRGELRPLPRPAKVKSEVE